MPRSFAESDNFGANADPFLAEIDATIAAAEQTAELPVTYTIPTQEPRLATPGELGLGPEWQESEHAPTDDRPFQGYPVASAEQFEVDGITYDARDPR